jgi:hypothetical protein
VLILHRGRQLLHGKLADLRQEISAGGQQETLEDLFFRLTEENKKSEAAVIPDVLPIVDDRLPDEESAR